MPSQLRRFILGAILFLVPYATNAYLQCYYPDGSVAKDYTFVECYTPSTDASAPSRHAPCCIPSEGDICQPNGLCWWPGGKALFRGACTDPTWQDPACQSISICADTLQRNATWMYVEKCIDDEWQCGALDGSSHSAASCNTKDEDFADAIQTRSTTMVAPTTFSRASTSTATPTSTSGTGTATSAGASQGTSTPAPASTTSSGGLSKGAIAGIAVGAWAGLTLLVSIAWFCGRRGKGQASSAAPNRTHGWEDDPWNQNTSGFGQPQTSMAAATSRGDGYQPNSGFGAANDPTKNGGTQEAVHEIGSEIGSNTLVPIGLAYAAKNSSAGSPPYGSPMSSLGTPLPRYQSPPAELPSTQPAAEMDGGRRAA